MNNSNFTRSLHRSGFTLIELLVVIAVIGILAALLFPVTTALKKNKVLSVARSEMGQVEAAIDAYKARFGTYPPDNPNPTLPGFLFNQLYFELVGTTNNIVNNVGFYGTRDGSSSMANTALATVYGGGPNPYVKGFVNTSSSLKSSDDAKTSESFIKDLKPGQVGELASSPNVKFLTCSIHWDRAPFPIANALPAGMNPWRYISTNPTNNPSSYDLWVDVLIGTKTNRISNWSKSPITL